MAVTAVDVFQVTVQPSTAQITVGGTIQLNATAFDAAGHDLRRNASWASSDATVATVNGSGLVTAVSTGGATVTATVDGKSGQAVLSILPKPVASVSLIPQSASLQAGDSVRLQLVVKATDGSTLTGRTATWASSDTRIVVVRPSGWVVALAAGTAAVSAVVEGFSAQAVISVRASSGVAVARVSVAPATSTLAVGDTLRFRATLTDATGQTLVGRVVTWTSNNTAVATVDGTGLVRALKAGSAIINAFSEGVSGAAQLTVAVPRPVSIEVTPSSSSLTLGSTIQLAASVKASDGSTLSGIPIVWSSLQPSIATVDATGLVTGLSIGAATIRAAAAGLTGTANIVVALQPVAIITLSPAVPAVTVGDTLVLTADLRDANGVPLAGRTVFWTSADPAIATVTGTGPTTPRANLVGVTPGTVDITASAEGKQTTVTATVLPKASLQVTKIA
ncbi:MAG: Ig-like domain-containing protein, partial [Gemmatimonadota bacterium]